MSVAILTRSQARALVNRLDLLSDEVQLVHRLGITWEARLEQLGTYGTSGGAAADRRKLVEAMAAAEQIANGSAYA